MLQCRVWDSGAQACGGTSARPPRAHPAPYTTARPPPTLHTPPAWLQTPEGVKVPEVLVPFMGGRTLLPFVRERPVSVEAKIAAKKEAKSGAGAASGGGAGGGSAPAAEAQVPGASST